MAQRVSTLLVDDLDGGEANETVTFSLGPQQLEIDLSEANAARLRGALSQYIGAARRIGGRRAKRSAAGSRSTRRSARGEAAPSAVPPVAFSSGEASTPKSDSGTPTRRSNHPLAFSSEVRAWAKAEGMAVGDRGRIANQVISAYETRTSSKSKKVRPKKAR